MVVCLPIFEIEKNQFRYIITSKGASLVRFVAKKEEKRDKYAYDRWKLTEEYLKIEEEAPDF